MGDTLLSDLRGLSLGEVTLDVFNSAGFYKVCQVRTATFFERQIQEVLNAMKVEDIDLQRTHVYWKGLGTRCLTIRNKLLHAGALPVSPSHFVCGICIDLLRDAVITPNGESYCYICITEQIRRNHTHPTTRQSLSIDHLIPNLNLRTAIKDYESNYQLYNIM